MYVRLKIPFHWIHFENILKYHSYSSRKSAGPVVAVHICSGVFEPLKPEIVVGR